MIWIVEAFGVGKWVPVGYPFTTRRDARIEANLWRKTYTRRKFRVAAYERRWK